MAIGPVFKNLPTDVVQWGKFFRNATNVEGTVTHEQLEDSAALSVIGRTANTVGSPDDIAATGNSQVLVTRADALVFDELVDSDIPSTIARDTEVTAAIVAHVGEADPHTQYSTAAEVTTAIGVHAAASDPHTVYVLEAAANLTGTQFIAGIISPAQIAADTDDYAPTGFSTATVLRLTTDASRNLNGLAGGASGRVIHVFNVGAFDLVLVSAAGTSTAANRFLFSANVTLNPEESITLWYDSASSRWRQLSRGN